MFLLSIFVLNKQINLLNFLTLKLSRSLLELLNDAIGTRDLGESGTILVVELEDNAIFDDHGATLGTVVTELGDRKVKLEAEGLGELTITVSDVADHTLASKFLSEGSDDKGVVDGQGEDFVATCSLDCLSLGNEVGHVSGHASGSEGSWVANDAHLLIFAIFSHVDDFA